MPRYLLALLLCVSLPLHATDVRELTWHEMIPPDAQQPATGQPAPLHDLSQLADALASESGPAAVQQSPAAPVVKALDGQRVKLPGYIVPLSNDDDNRVQEFLLVPFFGACIHVPPPPSNQIVYVTSVSGVKLDDLYQPFWIEGALEVEASSSELAEAGYRMAADKVYPYDLTQ